MTARKCLSLFKLVMCFNGVLARMYELVTGMATNNLAFVIVIPGSSYLAK